MTNSNFGGLLGMAVGLAVVDDVLFRHRVRRRISRKRRKYYYSYPRYYW